MKTFAGFAVIAAVLLGGAWIAIAADAPEGRGQGRGRGPGAEPGEHLRRLGDLGLSDEQKTQVRQILETHRQAVENFRKENEAQVKGLHEQMQAARAEGDTEKMQELRQQLRAIGEKRAELAKNLDKQMADVLNDEQEAKYKEIAQRMRRRAHVAGDLRGAFGALDLSDDQKKQIREIMKDSDGDFRAAMEKIKTDVLSKDQAAKFEEMAKRDRGRHARQGMAKALGLSDEQREQMQAVMQQARKDVQAAETPEAKRAVIEAAHAKVLSDVLTTDEQKAKFKQFTERMRERRMDRRRDGKGEGQGRPEGRGQRRQGRRERQNRKGAEE